MNLEITHITLDKGLTSVEIEGTLNLLARNCRVRFEGRMEVLGDVVSPTTSAPQVELSAPDPDKSTMIGTSIIEPPKQPAARKPKKAKTAETPEGRPESARQMILDILRPGPLTTGEVVAEVCVRRLGRAYRPSDPDSKRQYQATHANLTSAMNAGLVARIEHNSLDKWALA